MVRWHSPWLRRTHLTIEAEAWCRRLSCALTLVRFTCALTVLHYLVNLLGLELLRMCGAYEVCTRVLQCECRTQAVLRMHPV